MKKVSVKIDGIEYQITGEKDEAEIVKVAKYIDGELRQINTVAPSLSKISAAILTSVNIADQLFDARKENEELKNTIDGLKNNYSVKNDDIEKEFDSVLQKLDESETKILGMSNEIVRLKEIIDGKDLEIKKLTKENEKIYSTNPDDERTIKSLELKIKEMENKVSVAESMATEFQNKAYNIQLNYEKLKNSLNK